MISNIDNLYSGYALTQLPFHVRLYVKSFYPSPFRFVKNGGFVLEDSSFITNNS